MIPPQLQIILNCPLEVITLFELRSGLRIKISAIGSDSSVNYSTRSKFELGKDTGLNALKVVTRRTSARS